MREYFDHAYDSFCNLCQPIVQIAETIAEASKVVFVYITLPIWVIPYKLILRRKEKQ